MTTIRSALRMVESRWAITRVVRCPSAPSPMSCSSEAWTSRSASASRALVASSRIRMGASFRKARAMAMRWRWPPERVIPFSPTRVR